MFTKTDIEKYFIAEKAESLVFLAIGIAGIVLAIVFCFGLKTSFYKGAAIPLLLIGLFMGIVGFTIYKKSDNDRKRNVYAYDMDPGELRYNELPRMETVMKNFVIYRYVEMGLFVIGIFLLVYYRSEETKISWKGFGMTLAIMAVVALAADYFAEKRGQIYLNGLKEFTAHMGQ